MDDGLQVITENSSREDLLQHIAALERRLECDRVYVTDETVQKTLENPFGFREASLSPEERVRTIREGTDGIGCRDIGTALLEGRHDDPKAYPMGRRTAELLDRVVEAAKARGYVDGFRTARGLAVHYASFDAAKPPRISLIETMNITLDVIRPDAEARGALIDRVAAGLARAFSRPEKGDGV